MKKLFLTGLLFLFIPFCFLQAQVNKDALLKEARDLSKKALESAANIFSEKDYKKGDEALTDAEKYAKDPSDAESMVEKLNIAIEKFKAAIENAKTLSPNFTQLLKTRQLVLSIGIDVKLIEQFGDGDEKFVSAVEDFVDKDPQGVKKYSDEAEKYYKDAELIAIKEKYYGRLNSAIEKADDEDVDKFAPVTFNKLKQFAKEIEGIIIANRYDTLKARAVLNNANYELGHAQYMQRMFSAMKKEDKTFEDLQLMWEEPLAKIGSEYKIARSFDKGFDDFTTSVIENINGDRGKLAAAKKENENLNSSINDAKKQIDELKNNLNESKKETGKLTADLVNSRKENEELLKKIKALEDKGIELETKLAALGVESSKYKTQVNEQERIAGQVESLKNQFLPSEAEITRNGDLISIRLLNVVFPAKTATIEPQYFNLLGKVQKAIQNFPGASVVIEGHTDGQGDYQKNIETSQARANAVYQYLLANLGPEAKNITTVGLGGTKPIANNSTEEGKSKNRRIEIVINVANQKTAK